VVVVVVVVVAAAVGVGGVSLEDFLKEEMIFGCCHGAFA
jgi:hypothetical protein